MFIYEPTPVEGFDLQVYRLKSERGIVGTPNPEMTTNIACFGDNNMAGKHPDWVQMSKDGPALRTNKKYNFRWDIVCNHEKQMIDYMLDLIEDTAEKTKGITVSSMHYADHGFCTCPRCKEAYEKSGLDWLEWRAQAVTDFIGRAKRLVKQPFGIEIWPDPVLAKERFGLDFEALAEYVDFFHVPLSSHNYVTMYWVDTLTRDFKKLLKKPIFIELSAEILRELETKALLKTAAYVSSHNVEAILLLVHDAERAKQICRTAVNDSNYRGWLDKFGFENMNRIIERWEKIYGK
jgi:hypothetical protein